MAMPAAPRVVAPARSVRTRVPAVIRVTAATSQPHRLRSRRSARRARRGLGAGPPLGLGGGGAGIGCGGGRGAGPVHRVEDQGGLPGGRVRRPAG